MQTGSGGPQLSSTIDIYVFWSIELCYVRNKQTQNNVPQHGPLHATSLGRHIIGQPTSSLSLPSPPPPRPPSPRFPTHSLSTTPHVRSSAASANDDRAAGPDDASGLLPPTRLLAAGVPQSAASPGAPAVAAPRRRIARRQRRIFSSLSTPPSPPPPPERRSPVAHSTKVIPFNVGSRLAERERRGGVEHAFVQIEGYVLLLFSFFVAPKQQH